MLSRSHYAATDRVGRGTDAYSVVVPKMRAIPLARRGTGEMQVMAAVHETICQRVGAVGLSDEFMPSLDWDLAHDDRRGEHYALVNETQEIRPRALAELPEPKIIDDQQVPASQAFPQGDGPSVYLNWDTEVRSHQENL